MTTAPPPVDHVLAAYGTLRPGESNHAVVAPIGGRWFPGTIRGHLGTRRTGFYRGFPAFVPDPDGPVVAVAVLVAADLGAHWGRLDDFEGTGYRRVEIDVDLERGPWSTLRAHVYESIDDEG